MNFLEANFVAQEQKSPIEWCEAIRLEFKRKADHNKRESLLCFWFSVVGSIVTPLFVTMGEQISMLLGISDFEFVFSKLIPSVLSVLVATSAAWLQLRKPNNLWVLYRTAEKYIESETISYTYKVGEYKDCTNTDARLISRVLDRYSSAHEAWTTLVPNPEELANKRCN